MNPQSHSSYGKHPTDMARLLPAGAWLVSTIEAGRDFDRSTPERFVQATDKETGLPVWTAVVQSGDLDSPAWLRQFKLKIVCAEQPALPPLLPGTPFRPVWLDGLTITPYIDDKACTVPEQGRRHRCRARIAYSIRATAVAAPKPVVRPTPHRSEEGAA